MSKLTKYKLQDLYKISSGISTKPEQYGQGAPFLSFSTIFNNYFIPDELKELMNTNDKEQKTYSVMKGDVFLTRTSETLDELAMSCVALKDYPKATFSGFAKRLRPIQKNITYDKFMGFFLRSKYFRKIIDSNAIMTLRASFNEKIFSYINIDLIDYKEQVKIGDLLYYLEEKIKLNNKINSELEKMAKTLYEYWFVQFDFPDENKRPYKSANGKMVYNDILKREIPEGWEVENLANNRLTTILKPGIDKFENEKIYLPTAAITDDKITDRSNIISYENRESRANMQPISNSVWFAKMKKTKKILYFGNYSQKHMNEIILSTGMLGLKCKENSLEYIWNFVNDTYFEEIKDRLAHGATQESINNDDLVYIPILVPDDTTLQKFATKVKELYQKKYINEIENEQLTQLRDFLLPLLMNGQVSVSSEH